MDHEADTADMIGAHTVLELRQYTLHGGRRDELMRLFRREFVLPQDAVGSWVLATYRDLDDPDRFVWMRGFSDLAGRKTALERFYGGDVWSRLRSDANATIADSDNVLLLKPVQALASGARGRCELMRIAIHYLGQVPATVFADGFTERLAPLIGDCGGRVTGTYVTEPGPNNFRLPVRENERVFVWLSEFEDETAERRFSAALNARSGWRDGVAESLLPAFMRKPEVLRLAA